MKVFPLVLLCLWLPAVCWAQGTRTWEQTKYDEFEKGTAHGVAISSDGNLMLAPSFDSLYTSPSTYLWSLASDTQGNVYAAAGSPARVYKLTPDGKASIIFASQELQVQALVVDSSGVIYAATSPDGKVYRVGRGGASANAPGSSANAMEANTTVQEAAKATAGETTRLPLEVDSSYGATVFFDPKTKYIWALALDRQGQLYVGTGDRGEIFRVDRAGKGTLFFKSDEAQIRALDFDNSGNLIAGTDGSGLVYRISPEGEGFVLYSAPKKEITALAVDTEGNIYAAGAGEKRGPGVPPPPGPIVPVPVPVTPGPVTVVGPQGGSSGAAASPPGFTALPYPNVTNVGGSDVYRISADGSPKTIWSSREDLVYALAFAHAGRLLAGTGNRGKIYVLQGNQYTDLAKASANQVTAFARAPKGGLYAATSNLGKIFLLGPNLVTEGSYESDVFDAKNFSKWGRVEVRGEGSFDFFARSGNVDNPDRNWSPWRPINLDNELPIDAPAARFIQWKAVLHATPHTPVIDSVVLNYLPKNVAPEVDGVSVMVGWRVPAGVRSSDSSATSAYEAPIPTVRDRHSIVVKWKAHDDNDDTLDYDVYYRGDGEMSWKLLRENLDERFVNLEADLFPDGGYTIRVVASDAPSHSSEDTLTGEGLSSRFEVDNTPPKLESLNARMEGKQVRLTFRAEDSFSPIKRAEYSIDADDWQLIAPIGQISDYKIESYDVLVPISAGGNPELDGAPGSGGGNAAARSRPSGEEHTIIVRVYDRFENVGTGKIVVKTPAR